MLLAPRNTMTFLGMMGSISALIWVAFAATTPARPNRNMYHSAMAPSLQLKQPRHYVVCKKQLDECVGLERQSTSVTLDETRVLEIMPFTSFGGQQCPIMQLF